ncbi:MAG: DUF4112 domain-containing protein [Acidobacteriota bacterium]
MEQPVDARLDQIAYLLDRSIRIPGTNIRFGLDPILGLLFPVFGDAVTSVVSAYIVLASVRLGLPKIIVARMVFNIALDYLLGFIPLLGDLLDFAWKANDKNMRLLRRHVSEKDRSFWSDWAWVFFLLAGLAVLIIGGLLAVAALASAVWGHGLHG